MKPFFIYTIFLFHTLLYTGCAIKQPSYVLHEKYIDASLSQKEQKKILGLENYLVNEMQIDAREAKLVAKQAYLYPHVLAYKYALTWPPLLHNTLVNAGLKKKGLCFQWAEDFYILYRKMHLSSVDLYWGCANEEQYNEHNTLVITKKNAPFSTGIVLDPWRNSGELFWKPLLSDKKYIWRTREDLKELLDTLDLTQKNPSIFQH